MGIIGLEIRGNRKVGRSTRPLSAIIERNEMKLNRRQVISGGVAAVATLSFGKDLLAKGSLPSWFKVGANIYRKGTITGPNHINIYSRSQYPRFGVHNNKATEAWLIRQRSYTPNDPKEWGYPCEVLAINSDGTWKGKWLEETLFFDLKDINQWNDKVEVDSYNCLTCGKKSGPDPWRGGDFKTCYSTMWYKSCSDNCPIVWGSNCDMFYESVVHLYNLNSESKQNGQKGISKGDVLITEREDGRLLLTVSPKADVFKKVPGHLSPLFLEGESFKNKLALDYINNHGDPRQRAIPLNSLKDFSDLNLVASKIEDSLLGPWHGVNWRGVK